MSRRRSAKVGSSGIDGLIDSGDRLAGPVQRRLDDLIAKKKQTSLTDKEEKELAQTLDWIDDNSIRVLTAALAAPPSRGKRKPR